MNDAALDLGGVEGLPAVVPLDHQQGSQLNLFIGGEAAAAVHAFPPAADAVALFRGTGINYFAFQAVAVLASHGMAPLP